MNISKNIKDIFRNPFYMIFKLLISLKEMKSGDAPILIIINQ